jgi:hypothetical protein
MNQQNDRPGTPACTRSVAENGRDTRTQTLGLLLMEKHSQLISLALVNNNTCCCYFCDISFANSFANDEAILRPLLTPPPFPSSSFHLRSSHITSTTYSQGAC